MGYVIAADTGGTFVDAIVLDDAGQLTLGKAPSLPDDPATGLLGAVAAAAEARGLALAFCDNRPRALPGEPALDDALVRLAAEAVAAHA